MFEVRVGMLNKLVNVCSAWNIWRVLVVIYFP